MPIEPATTEAQSATGVEARVIADITKRQQRGIAKYGMSVEDNPLALRQWVQHFYEDLLDGAVYAKKIIEKIDEIDQRIGSEFVQIDTARMQLLTHLDVLGHRYPAMREDLEKMRPIVLALPTDEDGRV